MDRPPEPGFVEIAAQCNGELINFANIARDVGVDNKTIELKQGTYAYGKAFAHLVIAEAVRLNEYQQKDFRFSYLRTKDNAEIDLVVERPGASTALVEIKSTQRVDDRDTRSLERFAADIPRSEAFILSTDPVAKRIGKVKSFPWQQGLKELGLQNSVLDEGMDLFSLMPLFLQSGKSINLREPQEKLRKSWGLFGGKWEAKTAFRGLGGQIDGLDYGLP